MSHEPDLTQWTGHQVAARAAAGVQHRRRRLAGQPQVRHRRRQPLARRGEVVLRAEHEQRVAAKGGHPDLQEDDVDAADELVAVEEDLLLALPLRLEEERAPEGARVVLARLKLPDLLLCKRQEALRGGAVLVAVVRVRPEGVVEALHGVPQDGNQPGREAAVDGLHEQRQVRKAGRDARGLDGCPVCGARGGEAGVVHAAPEGVARAASVGAVLPAGHDDALEAGVRALPCSPVERECGRAGIAQEAVRLRGECRQRARRAVAVHVRLHALVRLRPEVRARVDLRHHLRVRRQAGVHVGGAGLEAAQDVEGRQAAKFAA
mmetsp:Transcript_43668/g.109566  ORF Transcript_43668/g.109566 Transcript_43668/m.109566 type:complete len:320 (-) Transcript_43668:309-1268(-)